MDAKDRSGNIHEVSSEHTICLWTGFMNVAASL
jgi:hypothetical protein